MQSRAMRRALDLADAVIFSVPPERLSWLKTIPSNVAFIPVGANLPSLESPASGSSGYIPTVGIFSITGGEQGVRETQQILAAVHHASRKLCRIRLSVFARHSDLHDA